MKVKKFAMTNITVRGVSVQGGSGNIYMFYPPSDKGERYVNVGIKEDIEFFDKDPRFHTEGKTKTPPKKEIPTVAPKTEEKKKEDE